MTKDAKNDEHVSVSITFLDVCTLKCTCWWILFEMIEFLSDTSNYILNYTRLIIEILKSSKPSVISFNNFETAFNDYNHQKSAFGTKIYFLPSIPILAISTPYILSIYTNVWITRNNYLQDAQGVANVINEKDYML